MQHVEMRLVAGRYDAAPAAEHARAVLDAAGIPAAVLPPTHGWVARLARALSRRPPAYLVGVPPDAVARARQLLGGVPGAPAA